MKKFLAQSYATPLWWLATSLGRGTQEILDHESRRWVDCLGRVDAPRDVAFERFAWLLVRFPEYRSLVHYRLRDLPLPVRMLARKLWRGQPTLFIHCDSIGQGLFIQHGFATTLTAESIGEDCWVRQQTTIGHTSKGMARIGDRVSIGAGAVIVGPIMVGDDVTIGVNATVVHDLPPGSTWLAPKATMR